MRRRLTIFLVPVAISVGMLASDFSAAAVQANATEPAGQGGKTVWDSVYTDAQAARGQAFSATYCSECHADDLSGAGFPPLRGDRFMERWREGSLKNLFSYISTMMPAERPSSLSDFRRKPFVFNDGPFQLETVNTVI